MSAIDQFSELQTGLASPATTLVSVTTSDSVDLTNACRAIHVAGTGGLVYVTGVGMATGTSTPVYIGQGGLFPIRASRIWTTGTTATGIVAAY